MKLAVRATFVGLIVAAVLLTTLSLSACESSPPANAEALVTEAESILTAYVAQEWSTVRSNFDSTMTSTLGEADLGSGWSQLLGMVGAYQSRGRGEGRMQAGYFVVDIPMQVERSEMKMPVVYNGDRRVAGLFVLVPDAP